MSDLNQVTNSKESVDNDAVLSASRTKLNQNPSPSTQLYPNDSEASSTNSGNKENLNPDSRPEERGTTRLDGAPSQSNTITRSRPSCCIFVASLASILSDDELWVSVVDHFKQFGEVVMAKVLRDGKKRPYAFVQYKTEQQANDALVQANNSVLNGRNIRCEKARVNRTLLIQERFPAPDSEKSIFLKLSRYGEIEKMINSDDYCSLKVPRGANINTENHCKSWFFQFAYRDDAISVHALLKNEGMYVAEWAENIVAPQKLNLVMGLNDLLKDGHCFLKPEPESLNDSEYNKSKAINHFNSREGNEIDTFSIFVGQLPNDCTEAELNNKFAVHGAIESINFFSKRGDNSFAFIKYKHGKSASLAIENENHSFFKSKTIHVQYRQKYHVSAEKRRYFSMNERSNGMNNSQNQPIGNTNYRNRFSNGEFNNFRSPSETYFQQSAPNFNSSGMQASTYIPYLPQRAGPFPHDHLYNGENGGEAPNTSSRHSHKNHTVYSNADDTKFNKQNYRTSSKSNYTQNHMVPPNYPYMVNPFYYNHQPMYGGSHYYPTTEVAVHQHTQEPLNRGSQVYGKDIEGYSDVRSRDFENQNHYAQTHAVDSPGFSKSGAMGPPAMHMNMSQPPNMSFQPPLMNGPPGPFPFGPVGMQSQLPLPPQSFNFDRNPNSNHPYKR